MFTGIVEESGIVRHIQRKKNLLALAVYAKKILKGIKAGDSVCVSGVCLTVTKRSTSMLIFDIMKETLQRTTLKDVRIGERVNLERALEAHSRISGHFVQGHVDGIGKIVGKIREPNFIALEVAVAKRLMRDIVSKGSICVDGISLTVGKVSKNKFSVYIIPHTFKITNLKDKGISDSVNIETDILAKYARRPQLLAGLRRGWH